MSGFTLEMLDDLVRRAREAPRPEWYIPAPRWLARIERQPARKSCRFETRAADQYPEWPWFPPHYVSEPPKVRDFRDEAMVIAREAVSE